MSPILENSQLHLIQMDPDSGVFYYVALDFDYSTTDYVMFLVHTATDILVAKWLGASTFQLDNANAQIAYNSFSAGYAGPTNSGIVMSTIQTTLASCYNSDADAYTRVFPTKQSLTLSLVSRLGNQLTYDTNTFDLIRHT